MITELKKLPNIEDGREEMVIDCLMKFWERALTTWLPND